MGKIAAQIMIESGSAPRDADNAKVPRHLGPEHPGTFEAIAGAGRVTNEFHQRVELRFELGDHLTQGTNLLGAEIKSDPTQGSHSTQQAVAGEMFVQAQHTLLQTHGVHIGRDE